jgi:hypothetical protein
LEVGGSSGTLPICNITSEELCPNKGLLDDDEFISPATVHHICRHLVQLGVKAIILQHLQLENRLKGIIIKYGNVERVNLAEEHPKNNHVDCYPRRR